MDPTQVGIGIGAAAIIAMLISTILKPLLETWVKPSAPLHDPAVRSMAILGGIIWYVGDYLVHAAHPNWTGAIDQHLPGIVIGAGSVVTYHLVTATTPAKASNSSTGGLNGMWVNPTGVTRTANTAAEASTGETPTA